MRNSAAGLFQPWQRHPAAERSLDAALGQWADLSDDASCGSGQGLAAIPGGDKSRRSDAWDPQPVEALLALAVADRDAEDGLALVWRRDDEEEYSHQVDRLFDESEDWLMPLAE